MAKNLLQDMVKRQSVGAPKVPEAVKIPIKISLPKKVVEPVYTPPPVVEKAKEPEEAPKIIKTPEKTILERPKYSGFESRFASINDVGGYKDPDKSRFALWMVAGVSALFLIFALSFLFSSAKITVSPKIKDQNVNLDLSAMKDSDQGGLPFDVVVISGEEHETVTAGEEKDVAVKATGKVVLYNAFSTSPQSLSIDTRLEGSNGKLYKTTTKTTVPGMKGTTPGSIEVGIYASEAGAEYNSTALDFKIFGFKGTPKYAKFYARSKGDLTGGFKGKSSDVSDSDKARIIAKLKPVLQSKLLAKAEEQIPSGFVLFKDGALFNTNNDELKLTPSSNNTAVASLSGTFSGFLFDEKKLTAKIAEKILPNEDASKIYLKNIRDLTLSLVSKDSLTSLSQSIAFTLSGNLRVVWKIDEEKLISDIVGQPKKSFNTILSSYQNIDSAQLVIRPFWKTSLPTKNKDIKIIVNYPN
ncbi:MAG: hypothetical protein KBC06_00565 [Candidatus Pacebacteria bacterium]|nr:hypothetical protein [Candidatus Paceibacterota bacterium]